MKYSVRKTTRHHGSLSSVDSTAVAQTPSFRVSERQLQRRRQSNLSPDTPVLPLLARVRSLRALLAIVVLCVAAVVVASSVYLLCVVGRVDNGIGYEDGGWHLTALLSNSTALTTMTTAARTAAASVELRPIRIGEDCSSPLTKCVYFNPRQFLAERQSMRNRSEDEDEDEDERGPRRRRRRIEHDVCYVNLIKYMYLRCHPRDVYRNKRSFRHEKGRSHCNNDTSNVTGREDDEEGSVEGGTLRCHPRCRSGGSSGRLDMPTEVTFYHVFKTGGTSLFTALKTVQMRRTLVNNLDRKGVVKARNHSEYIERMQTLDTEKERRRKRTNSGEVGGHVAVAVIRDPIERFASAASQVLSFGRLRPCQRRYKMTATSKNATDGGANSTAASIANARTIERADTTVTGRSNKRTVKMDPTTKLDMLRCVLDMAMHNRTSFGVLGVRDPHLESQFADLACKTNGANVTLSLYRQEDLTELLGQLLGPATDNGEDKNRTANTSSTTNTDRIETDRNSTSASTNPAINITRLNVGSAKKHSFDVSDMDEQLIEDICEFYSIDVDMMRWLGFDVPLCSRSRPG